MTALEAYLARLPAARRERVRTMCGAFRRADRKARLGMTYRMPTFERDGNRVAVGSQKNHVCVYFCCRDLIANVAAAHPGINTGVGCVRIRDNQEIPLRELVRSFKRAMKWDAGASRRSREETRTT